MTSETIYNPENYEKLLNFFKSRLKSTGKVYLSAKSYYFGVSGNMLDFCKLLDDDATFDYEVLKKFVDGVQREILQIQFKRSWNPSTENQDFISFKCYLRKFVTRAFEVHWVFLAFPVSLFPVSWNFSPKNHRKKKFFRSIFLVKFCYHVAKVHFPLKVDVNSNLRLEVECWKAVESGKLCEKPRSIS